RSEEYPTVEPRPAAPALTASAPASTNAQARQLMPEVIRFTLSGMPEGDLKKAVRLFFDKPLGHLNESTLESGDFLQWMVYDFRARSAGRTPLEQYLHEMGPRLSQSQRAALESWQAARYGLYEVQRVEEGRGVDLRDLLAGDTFFVNDVSSSKS